MYGIVMSLSTDLFNALRISNKMDTFMDSWNILHNVEAIVPVVVLALLLIIVFFKKEFFSTLNFIMGYRVFVVGVGLMSLFFIIVDKGPVLYLISGLCSVLIVLSQILVMMLLVNCCFKSEIGLVIAWVPDLTTIHTFLLYPLHCLGDIGTFITFSATTIVLGVAVSFWRLSPPVINIPKTGQREPSPVIHIAWLWFFLLPLGFFIIGAGFLLYNGFPCPVPSSHM